MEHEDRGIRNDPNGLGSTTSLLRDLFDVRGVDYSALGPYTTYVKDGNEMLFKMSDMFNGTVNVEFVTHMEPSRALWTVLRHLPVTRVDVTCNDEGVGHGTCMSCGERAEPNYKYCPSCGAMIRHAD